MRSLKVFSNSETVIFIVLRKYVPRHLADALGGCGSQLVNSLYYNMVTLTTIGFGEISPVGVGEKVRRRARGGLDSALESLSHLPAADCRRGPPPTVSL